MDAARAAAGLARSAAIAGRRVSVVAWVLARPMAWVARRTARGVSAALEARWGRLAAPLFALAIAVASVAALPPARQAASDLWDGLRAGVAEQPEHRILRVAIRGALRVDDDALIAAALPDGAGVSALAFDLDAARDRIEALGWVRRAAVSIRPPQTLVIAIDEQVPAARWRFAGDLVLIDAEGRRITRLDEPGDLATATVGPDAAEAALSDARRWSALPLVLGPGAGAALGEAIALDRRLGAAGLRAVGWSRVAGRRWNLHLFAGPLILLPEEDPHAALDMAIDWIRNAGLLEHDFERVDLRLPDAPTARLREPR